MTLEAEMQMLKQSATDVEAQLSTKVVELKGEKGPMCRRLDETLKKLGADRGAYFQTFNGNQVHALLRNEAAEILWGIFPEFPQKSKYFELHKALGRLQHFARARFLSDDDIVAFDAARIEFLNLLIEVEPHRSVTRKMHMLLAHVKPFMEQWRTWGLMCEQPIEAFHAVYNRLARRFAGIRNEQQRRLAIVEAISFSTFLIDTTETSS